MRIDVDRVSFGYGAATALDGVSTSLQSGELLAILGRNGSGKSTLVKLLARVLKPQSGTISLDGAPVERTDRRLYAQRVGYLPQEISIALPMRAIDVVVTGRFPYLSRFAFETGADIEIAERALARCDVLELRDRYLDQMSGGERRRVFLARVLAGDPEFLLLDEPLSALDAGHAQDLLALLRGIVADGKTVAYVTHDVNSALGAADRVLVLDRGRVAGAGVPHEVLTPQFVERWFGFRSESVQTASGRHWIVPL